ncbi:MAG: oxygen-independent coproporphyrinogen III oxidase [Thiopseudomonas sp.]|jgi:oxygen-independent coproporphyrinogen-3 oxidase|uniref:oxygen-independent coproporphyrinogen III oxidase n=1 Tax=Denitrificimonas caeni TaxID=521720 RepID=UPI0003B695D3|nr:oxygen-independent coproporphyrinogen III oxidase [Denitrificimonas caeni]MBP7958813.1 oxygen-independent coproporphyrinogen III oxidase [Thiopseudomonas sp.]HHX06479.1 oxygen-independent coproporphyrinogen III oxidase [Pseudomonas sp.]MBP7996876.1 oxygen-independent coproporphyrinogen III oxidase [Thiopseudomonas sp.]MBP8007951.1 oxygen-independent coproporphyrinogen III oxidase [Thiopseudomonas sp.]MBP8770976.1 oxygen-independent coproporphyrinogen III oxidase [Thiopseudomonas sp.]
MLNTMGWSSKLFNLYHNLDKPYSSYPRVEHFQQNISAFERFSALRDSRKAQRPLVLNVNIPFCANACYYCSKKNIVTKDRSRAAQYLQCLEQEIQTVAQHIASERNIEELHFGGGTPTFLNPVELRQLMRCLQDNFNITSNNFTHYSIDIDPRETDWSTMGVLRDIGFNRVNIEVQGLDPKVQRAINRLQTIEQTQAIVEAARTLQFRTVSISLIYGLPQQTTQSFSQAVEDVLQLAPDRISLQGYQHQPDKHPIQQRINAAELPSIANLEAMLKGTQLQLEQAGYRYIGMGHFALADDDFAYAQEDGTLQQGIQGYSTSANCDTLGFGVSAVSQLGNLYYHNSHDINSYQTACRNQQLPPATGVLCTKKDQIHRAVIQALTCQFEVNFSVIEQCFAIDFASYFAAQWPQLLRMQSNGLLELSEQKLSITAPGRLYTLTVCQLFDDYLAQDTNQTPSLVQMM